MRLLPRVGWWGHLGISACPEGTSSCWWEHVASQMGDTEPGPVSLVLLTPPSPPHTVLPRLLQTPWLPAWSEEHSPPGVGSTVCLEGGAQPTWRGEHSLDSLLMSSNEDRSMGLPGGGLDS